MGTTYHSAVIETPVDRVWHAIRDFHDVSWAPGVLTKCVVVGDKKGDQIGARRLLNDQFHETLLALDDVDRAMRYQIDDGPSPVSRREIHDFVARLRCLPVTATGHTFLELSASWEGSGEPVSRFAGPIYEAILAAARKALHGV